MNGRPQSTVLFFFLFTLGFGLFAGWMILPTTVVAAEEKEYHPIDGQWTSELGIHWTFVNCGNHVEMTSDSGLDYIGFWLVQGRQFEFVVDLQTAIAFFENDHTIQWKMKDTKSNQKGFWTKVDAEAETSEE